MDTLAIRELWKPDYHNPKASVDWWNSKAEQFSTRDIPTADTSLAMAIIQRENLVHSGDKTLDVGCGGGRFSFALEALGAEATATDFSPEMIKKASESGQSRNSKVQFAVADWHTADLREKGWEKAFDLVLANMTPAIVSADTFLKLIDASRGWVMMVKPTRRTNSVFDELNKLVNAEQESKALKETLTFAIELVLNMGGQPRLEYQQRNMEHSRPLEEAAVDYTKRIASSRELSDADEKKIKDYLESIAVDGMIHEKSESTIAAMYWKVC
ncbi:MAG: class I SAM-dependent methyltransferase [Clostridia bacterium]|nr:class I SAM-dependent methyltransferase [Clostridia bacterium]